MTIVLAVIALATRDSNCSCTVAPSVQTTMSNPNFSLDHSPILNHDGYTMSCTVIICLVEKSHALLFFNSLAAIHSCELCTSLPFPPVFMLIDVEKVGVWLYMLCMLV